ncbi:MAG TPA: NAD-dependent epimerase/dehydratase family protein [Chloroflexota bacterium]|nr:NAD-dependent epimerase/dehydratase family protein [Chloroflexota bacterium]
MKVLVTGGTGFVGSHSVAALVRAGHAVRLLTRSRDRVAAALAPLGVADDVAADDVVGGDVTDPAAVARAVEGCDAVLHGASVFSLDPRMDGAIRHTNVRGTEVVLGAAAARGLDPIVHVSSTTAFLGRPGVTITPDTPPGKPTPIYSRSKAESERVARGFQERGAPVVITYPGGVYGPDDPHFGESARVVRSALFGLLLIVPTGQFAISDVRDLALLHARLFEPGRGPRRYCALAHNVSVAEEVRAIARATGRRLPCAAVPAPLLMPLMRALDLLQPRVPVRLPFSSEQLYVPAQSAAVDDSATRREFDLEPRGLTDTMADTVRWLVRTGRAPRWLAGRLATTA